MKNLIEYVYKANDKLNIKLAETGDQVKIITMDDTSSVIELYRAVHAELQAAKCEKFMHPLKENDIEELVNSEDSAIVGYFKEGKHLAGVLYTKPFESNSKFFQTPAFEGDKTVYAIGGLAVHPDYRGNGVVSKIANVAVNGVKDYALSNPESKIAGTGFEISCENFGSLMSLGGAKDDENNPIFNLLGIHYLDDQKSTDTDLTVLGYTSFEQQPKELESLPQVTLNGVQAESYESLGQAMSEIANEANGTNTVNIEGHNITTFNDYVNAPIKSVLNFAEGYAETYLAVAEK